MPDTPSLAWRLTVEFGLDLVQPADTLQALVCQGAGQFVLSHVDVPELAARVARCGIAVDPHA